MRPVDDYAPSPCSVDININDNPILANLEDPLLFQNHSFMPSPKAGPNLYSRELPDSSADYIFSLANNNHKMDFGQAGMNATIHTLHKRGIRYCGAGTTIQSARTLLTICYQEGSEKICVEESSSEEWKRHMQYLEICNYPLHDEDLFEALCQEVAVRAYYAYDGHYLGSLSPPSSVGSCIKEFLSMLERAVFRQVRSVKTDTQILLLYYHVLACESHRQMLTTALGVLSGEITDLRNNETHRLADEMMPWSCEVYRQ